MQDSRVLVFDLRGTWAHFRKVYTNSSSLTYAFPPRTTIVGLVAGILGRPRDCYYEEFSCDRCRVAVSIRIPSRRLVQTVNYIRTKGDWRGKPTPVPVEFVVPASQGEQLHYRVFLGHADAHLMTEVKSLLLDGRSKFPPYLGITECPGTAVLVDGEARASEVDPSLLEPLALATVIPVSLVGPENLALSVGTCIMKEDRVPLEFSSDRRITRIGDFLYERSGGTILVKPARSVYRFEYRESGTALTEWGAFMQ